MIGSNTIIELQKKYESGERDFSKIELRRANLKGINLSQADLRGADFSYANLREANLSGANLSEAYFNEADLTGANLEGANLEGAFLIKAYLIKMNLKEVNLSQAYLTGSYLTKSDLSQANLSGAYLNSSKLTGTILTGAYYDKKTHFDITFDAPRNGLQEIIVKVKPLIQEPIIQEPKITVEDLINAFNHLSQISVNYLGHTMTTRYWETSRPNDEWLTEFQFNRSAKIIFSGEQQQDLDPTQIQKAQEWFNLFIKSCAKIIQDFPRMIDLKQITFPLSSLEVYQEKKMLLGKLQSNKPFPSQTVSGKISTRTEVLTVTNLN